MKNHYRLSSILFYGLTLIMLVVAVTSFIGALSWLNKPFPGFLIYKPPYVASLGSRDWPGPKAGIRFMDRIVTVDGQTVARGRDVVNIVRDKKPGTPVQYIIESKGEIREISVPVTIFGFKDFILVFLAAFLCGLAIYVLGVIVYVLKPNIKTSWVFFLLCLPLGTYLVTSLEIQSTYYLVYFHYLCIPLFAAAWFHLGSVFPDKKRILIRLPWLEYLIYIPAFVLILAWEVYMFGLPRFLDSNSLSASIFNYKFLGSTARLFWLICMASMLIFVFHATFKAPSILSRKRAKMMLFGLTIAFLPSTLITVIATFMRVNFPWNFLVFFVIFFPASIAYSIVRHNLFDADTIIQRTVGYFVVTAIVIGAYALVSVGFNVLLGQYQLAQSRAFPILFTLGVILIFNPLRDRIQSLVDRIFFRKEYDYGEIVDTVSGAMTTMLELPQIVKRLVQTFMDDMFVSTSSVMLLAADGNQFQVYLADGEKKEEVENAAFKRDDPLMEIIEGEKKELTKYDVLEDPKYSSVSEKSSASFEALHANLMVPLVYQDQVIGALNLGEKKSGKPFNREDIDLLRTIANQGAVAIENARLFQENLEKQRMEEELNIARDLQMSMLPAECPTVAGFDIAAYSVSAREVGGDFYDFIDMGEDKAGLVIADVTGKSVSGALVMSASRSVFRMLSEEDLGVSDSMIRANRRLKKDVKSGMFVALLFAVMDSQEKKLTLCIAGQTQPVLMSAKTSEAILVDTQGDTFPLGILEDANYEETQLQLGPGDKVVFYTDGIVEAMNEQEEMFGFEKLQEVIKTSSADTAEALMNEIISSVRDFTGDAPQHDDITVIVVGVTE
jgi:sigma-B regulation protein RsbU (phosphoserine phosphatase)